MTFNKDNTVIPYPRPVLRVVWLPNRKLVTGLVYFDPERVALIRINPINNKFALSIKHSIFTLSHRFYPVLIRTRSSSTDPGSDLDSVVNSGPESPGPMPIRIAFLTQPVLD